MAILFALLLTDVVYSQEVTFNEQRETRETATAPKLFDRYSAQRATYVELKQSVVDGDFAEIKRRRAALDGYPLEFYFDYLVLRQRIKQHDHPLRLLDAIVDYRQRYNDSRLHRRLRFGKNTVLATAAYNAGPHRVSQWITDRTMPADIWVETIPFDETRRYVKAVLFNTTVSEWRMQKGTLTRLRQRMPDVLPLG